MDWFKSYFANRMMKVKCNTGSGGTSISIQYRVEYCTPQESCLGPLIFLIFCKDFHLHLSFLEYIQFADDTTLYIGHVNLYYIQFCTEYDLLMLHIWFNAHKLTLNIIKSVVMGFSTKIALHSRFNWVTNTCLLYHTPSF